MRRLGEQVEERLGIHSGGHDWMSVDVYAHDEAIDE